MRSKPFVALAVAPALLALAACDNLRPTGGPIIENPSLALNRTNALSLVATANVSDADSVRAIYWTPGGPQLVTPFYPASQAATGIPVLGLVPQSDYAVVLDARNGEARTLSATTFGRTGSIPEALQRVKMSVTGTAGPGYLLLPIWTTGATGYAVAFDGAGNVAWYREFAINAGQRVDEPELQPNGNFTTYVGSTTGWQADSGAFVEYTPAGDIVRTWSIPTPQYTDEHEIILTDGGNQAHFFTYDLRQLDLSAYGGSANATVAGHSLVRMDANGSIGFTWNAWDHIALSEWSGSAAGVLDFDHPNALTFDRDGNYVISFRNLSQIRKINATTGNAIWTLGLNGEFTFPNDPDGGPSFQHSARILDDGHLMVFDNGTAHTPQESRAVEYALDLNARTATVVWQYRHAPPIYTAIMGYVQRLSNGNTIVSFSQAGVTNEVSPAGQMLWEGRVTLDGSPNQFYRARRIISLYRYEPA